MAKHAAPRTRSPFWTLTAGAVTGACIALGTAGVTTTVEGQAHAAAQSYDLAHEDTSDTTCWAEKVHGAIEDVEVICGARGLRPATDTADLGATVWVASDPLDGAYEPWVVTITGLEPDSTN